jgi:HEAT repeat protein
LRGLNSAEEEERLSALSNLGYFACGRQLPWANEILIFHALHRDRVVRRTAIRALGELARVRGYADHGRVERVLAGAMRDECKWVREAAERAADEIRRFAESSQAI